ncbi:hypothetical protein BH11MYX3_BH11MYX3_21600 [soil metagenome]
MRAPLAVCFVLAAAAPALADPHNEISLSSYARALRSSSANAVTADGLFGGALGYAREIKLGLMPRLETWATGNFSWGGADGTMFSTLTTEVRTLSFTVGGGARYFVFDRLAVGGRLDVGTARAALTLEEGSRSLHDSGWGGTGTAAASIDMLAIAARSFKLGLRFELGYSMTTAIDLAPSEANDASTIQLEMSQASLGHLDMGGRFFSFALMSQF